MQHLSFFVKRSDDYLTVTCYKRMIVLLLDVNTRSLRIYVTATCAAGLKLTGYDSRKMCFIFFQLGLNISNWEKISIWHLEKVRISALVRPLEKDLGAVSQKILRLRYTLGTSSSSWKNTTSAIVCQQTICTTISSHSMSLVTFENTRNHNIMIFCEAQFCS